MAISILSDKEVGPQVVCLIASSEHDSNTRYRTHPGYAFGNMEHIQLVPGTFRLIEGHMMPPTGVGLTGRRHHSHVQSRSTIYILLLDQ